MRNLEAQHFAVHLAAERERAIRRNDPVVPFALFDSGVVDGLAGFPEVPASAGRAQTLPPAVGGRGTAAAEIRTALVSGGSG
jgi:hypothetical protein